MADGTPSHEEIASRAYELYISRGRTDGHDVGDWLEAERQIRDAAESSRATPKKSRRWMSRR
jgi:hypothetical protein